jgi:hypothetical protein
MKIWLNPNIYYSFDFKYVMIIFEVLISRFFVIIVSRWEEALALGCCF